MDDRRSQHLYGLGVVAVALLLGLFFVSGALKDIRKGNEEVTVTGSARRPIRSDFVVWRFTVSVQSSSMVSASQELSRGTDRVRAFLKEQGVADSLLTVKPVEASGVSETLPDGRETGRVIATRLSQAFEIRSYDVDGVTKVSQQASTLIAEGVPLQPSAPEYLYTKLGDIRAGLLEDATRDAKQRAEAIAKSTDRRVGAVRDARMGVFQITPRFSTEISDYGVSDVSSIEKDVTAVVRATFQLK
ncbi:MAG: SIMPL domain-containing protein [Gemmatimonadaceae bacterium]